MIDAARAIPLHAFPAHKLPDPFDTKTAAGHAAADDETPVLSDIDLLTRSRSPGFLRYLDTVDLGKIFSDGGEACAWGRGGRMGGGGTSTHTGGTPLLFLAGAATRHAPVLSLSLSPAAQWVCGRWGEERQRPPRGCRPMQGVEGARVATH